MNKKRKRFQYGSYPTITMQDFLNNFVFENGLGRAVNTTTGEIIDARTTDINHYDIDELAFEGVVRLSWDDVSQDKLLKGEILLVQATSWKGKGHMVIPYKRPQIVLQDGYACALQKEKDTIIESAPLPNSYSLRRTKRKGKKRY